MEKLKFILKIRREFRMKKILLMMIVILSMSVLACAMDMKPGVWVGYASVNMDDINKQVSILDTKISNGIILGADYDFVLNENFSVGPRLSYLTTNEGKYEYTNYYSRGDFDHYKYKVDASLTSIMVGGKYTKPLNDKFSVNGAVYLGLGFGKLTEEFSNDWKILNYVDSYSFKENYDGNSVVANMSVGGEFKFNDKLSIGANLGYDAANITEIKDSHGRKVLKYNSDNNLELDFSGVRLTAGVNFKF
jgi:hypothetical protein